jgi:two-component system OmpR family sensor kinase
VSGGESIGTAALGLVLASAFVSALRARRLERRLRSLAPPLHELRGAMSALGLGLALIERDPLLRRHGARFDALRAQLGRAGAAIDELDRARGTRVADEADQPPQLLDLASLLGRRARTWSQLAPAYGARLRLSWRAGSVALLGDRSRLEQAIDNLIANALEHGGSQVVVEGVRRGATVRISIWDSGAGLCRPSDGISAASAGSTRGHGLGIVRAAIEWHGGRLSFVRRDGGAAVDVLLPVEPAEGFRAVRTRGAGRESRIGSAAARAA